MHDRIKWLGMGYIEQGFVFADDLDDLEIMFEGYKASGGNGFICAVMEQVRKLTKEFRGISNKITEGGN